MMESVRRLVVDIIVAARKESWDGIANSIKMIVHRNLVRMLLNAWMVMETTRVRVASRITVGINVSTSINVS